LLPGSRVQVFACLRHTAKNFRSAWEDTYSISSFYRKPTASACFDGTAVFGDWPRLREDVLHRDRHRCRGCGRKGQAASLDAFAIRPPEHRAEGVITLCARCQEVVAHLQRNDRISAIFIFSGRNETRYYAVPGRAGMIQESCAG
jgi:hypothetical protein